MSNKFATDEKYEEIDDELNVVYYAIQHLEGCNSLSRDQEDALRQLRIRYEYLNALQIGIRKAQRGY
ncbi:MAG TPA: hypothetical protein VFM18_12635 [Methanosarcina sp.]|nr:hypothetical protein [Methanosarcina sp.]